MDSENPLGRKPTESRIKVSFDINGVLCQFNIISVISRRQLTLFVSLLGFTGTRLGLWIFLPKDTRTPPRKTDMIRCCSNTGPLDYDSIQFTTEPRRGLPSTFKKKKKELKVEKIVGKGKIACYEQFLLFPQYFPKLIVVDASKWVFME